MSTFVESIKLFVASHPKLVKTGAVVVGAVAAVITVAMVTKSTADDLEEFKADEGNTEIEEAN